VELRSEWIEYPSAGTPIRAYFARPVPAAEAPLPAVVVIQEIWGVDDHIQDVTCRIASAGYTALAPDLYSRDRQEALQPERIGAAKAFLNGLPPGAWGNPADRDAALARLPEPARGQVSASLGALFSGGRNTGQFLADLRGAVAYLAALPGCAGRRIGSVGFCMGGALSAQLACTEPGISGAAVFYGSSPAAEQAAQARCPLSGFYGALDTRITAGVPAFEAAVRSAGGSFASHVYPEAPHAFFNDTRPSYRVEAARDAWARLLGFFAQTLA